MQSTQELEQIKVEEIEIIPLIGSVQDFQEWKK